MFFCGTPISNRSAIPLGVVMTLNSLCGGGIGTPGAVVEDVGSGGGGEIGIPGAVVEDCCDGAGGAGGVGGATGLGGGRCGPVRSSRSISSPGPKKGSSGMIYCVPGAKKSLVSTTGGGPPAPPPPSITLSNASFNEVTAVLTFCLSTDCNTPIIPSLSVIN